jgi:hypothetical protein
MDEQTPDVPAPAPWYSQALSTLRGWLTADIEVKHHFDFTVDLNLRPWHILAVTAAVYLVWRLI